MTKIDTPQEENKTSKYKADKYYVIIFRKKGTQTITGKTPVYKGDEVEAAAEASKTGHEKKIKCLVSYDIVEVK